MESLLEYYYEQFRKDLRNYFIGSKPSSITVIGDVDRDFLNSLGQTQKRLFSTFFLLNVILQKAVIDLLGKAALKDSARALKLPVIKAIADHPEADAMDMLRLAGLCAERISDDPEEQKCFAWNAAEVLYKEIETRLQLGSENADDQCRLKEEFQGRAIEMLSQS